jgi:hypothetical protein
MGIVDDLEELELDLTPRREGSARSIRAGIKFTRRATRSAPKWKQQQAAERRAADRRERER